MTDKDFIINLPDKDIKILSIYEDCENNTTKVIYLDLTNNNYNCMHLNVTASCEQLNNGIIA